MIKEFEFDGSLESLLSVPFEIRDQSWETQFFLKFTSASVELISDGPQTGPDGFPYLLVKTSASASEPVQKVIHWASTRGVGLVVNPENEYPDFVFTYGMLWHFRETGLFYKTQREIPTGSVFLETGVQFGEPTDAFFPHYVRKMLREFFRDQGLHRVKFFCMQSPRGFYDLVFSLNSLGHPPEKEHEGIAEAISWFLPSHYPVILSTEAQLPEAWVEL